MKVLFVSSLSSYYSNENSSYMQRLTFLKEGLEKLGVETDIIYLGDYLFGKPAIFSPIVVYKLKNKMENYDFVHAGGAGSAYAISVIKKIFKPKINLIYDIHGDTVGENYLFKKGIFDIVTYFKIFQAMIMENISAKISDYFITCSSPLKDFYLSKGISKDNIEIITNSVDTELFKPKTEKEEKNTRFNVTYAGGFQEWQGIDILLGCANLLNDKDITFRIIGFRKENYELKKSIQNYLGDKCELIDSLPRKKLVEYLNESDVLIIPREKNNALNMAFPTKFAEYVSCGIPIILTNVSEAAKLVKEYECGIVCESSPDSLAEAIIKIKNLNAEEWMKMGKNGRKLAKYRLDKDIICKDYFIKLKCWKEKDE